MDVSAVLSMITVATVLAVTFLVLAALSHRRILAAETSRKAAHIAVGLVAVSFGWLFDETLPVTLLSVGGMAFTIAMRMVPFLYRLVGPVVHSVGRRSFGDYCIPVVVPLLHWLAMPDTVMYVVPMLVLTLADSAAALVGRRFGCWAYRTDDGSKTLEGSATVALMTGVIVLGALLLEGFGWQRAASLSLLMAILMMLAEAVCWRGLDNLVLPLGSFVLLKTYETLPDQLIIERVLASVVLTAFAMVWHRRAGMMGAAGVAAAFAIYACWAIGGIVWAVQPLVLLVMLPFLGVSRGDDGAHDIGVGPVLSMSSVPLMWLFLESAGAVDSAFLAFLSAWAAVLGVAWIIRHRRAQTTDEGDRLLLLKVLLALAAMGVLASELPRGTERPAITLALVLVSLLFAAGVEALADWRRRLGSGDLAWIARACIVLLASSATMALSHLAGDLFRVA